MIRAYERVFPRIPIITPNVTEPLPLFVLITRKSAKSLLTLKLLSLKLRSHISHSIIKGQRISSEFSPCIKVYEALRRILFLKYLLH